MVKIEIKGDGCEMRADRPDGEFGQLVTPDIAQLLEMFPKLRRAELFEVMFAFRRIKRSSNGGTKMKRAK